MLISAMTGGNVTSSTRNVGTGGVAAAHAPYQVLTWRSPIQSPHLSQDGRETLATAVAAKIRSLGM